MTSACVRSGYCCKKAACPFGLMVEGGCFYLGGDRPGEYYCELYGWIILQPEADTSPAFGAGCCSPLNSDRRKGATP